VFQNVQRQLGQLRNQERQINKRLKKAALPDVEPRTLSSFNALVSDRIDQIDGLVKADVVTVANFTAKNARPTQFN
jgi:hypothetical protein